MMMNSRAFVIVIASMRARVSPLSKGTLCFSKSSQFGNLPVQNPSVILFSRRILRPIAYKATVRSACILPTNGSCVPSLRSSVADHAGHTHDVSYESCLARPHAKTPHNAAASKFQARLPIIALPPPPWGLLFISVDEWTTTGQQMSPVSSVNKPIRGGEAALSPSQASLRRCAAPR